MKVYCVGLLIDEPPPPKGEEILREMEAALDDSRPYMIMMGRGFGKTSLTECAAVYALATEKRRFPVVVSANARAAGDILNDVFRAFVEPGTPFAHDYPDLCVPLQEASGSYRRRQTYRDLPTEISKTAGRAVFARLQRPDGTTPSSGCVIATRGITSGIRGLKHRTLRPDLVLLDDLQTAADAESPAAVEKLLNILRKDVMNLAGKGKLAVLQTATPICPEDLTERIAADVNWKTTKFPAILSWPKDILDKGDKGLWAQYFRLYDEENVSDAPHAGSLAFYKQHRAEMDDGAEVFNPGRFKESDGHISALQALLERRHLIGDAAFSAEMQMAPKRFSFSLDITPKAVASKVGDFARNQPPDGFVFVAASTDLNVSYAASTAVVAFRRDMTAAVLDHFTTRCRIDGKLNDTAYNQEVYALLGRVAQRLKASGLRFDGWAVDSGGRNWDAACLFAKNCGKAYGLPCCAFAGRSATVFNPYVRSRLREAIGRTVLCGDAAEQVKAGSGSKYVFFDADLYKELAQRAFMSDLGAPGSCSLYQAGPGEHTEFAMQVCNEKLLFVRHSQNGKNYYNWKTQEPHDFLDCMSMCFAVAASQGVSGQNGIAPAASGRRRFAPKQRPRVRVV